MAIKKLYPFSETHKKVIINFNNFVINILQGAVRSGKSYLADILTLKEIKGKKGVVAFTGNTTDTVKKNVISKFEGYLNCKIIFKNNSFGQYFIIDKDGYRDLTCYVIGAGKEGDHKKIQGMEILYWYADEVATYNKNFFDMMLTRLCIRDYDGNLISKAILTLNPESPTHWLKKWIDENTDKKNTKYTKGFVISNTFIIDDNYSLSKQYVQQIKNSLSGHMYQRLILGKWSVGEGLVYSVDKLNIVNKKNEEINNILKNKTNLKFTIGVDIGTTHETAFILVCKNTKTNKYYVLKEYYKNKVAPSQLVIDLKNFYEECKKEFDIYNTIEVKYDHAAAYFAAEFNQTNKTNITLTKAKKSVLEGIMFIERQILNNNFFILDSCVNLINEFNGYSWDTNKNNEVIKIKDDAIDALRYAIFSNEYQSSSY